MRYLYTFAIAALMLMSAFDAKAPIEDSATYEDTISVQILERCTESTPLTRKAAAPSNVNTEATSAALCINEPCVYVLPSVKLQCKQILEDLGYGPVQVAAILGNIQVESGFRTRIYGHYNNKTYYGLFQWDLDYTPEADQLPVTQQCLLMHETIEKQFKTHPGKDTVEDFMNCSDPGKAAKLFAKYYERCGEGSYNKRAQCAQSIYKELYGKE